MLSVSAPPNISMNRFQHECFPLTTTTTTTALTGSSSNNDYKVLLPPNVIESKVQPIVRDLVPSMSTTNDVDVKSQQQEERWAKKTATIEPTECGAPPPPPPPPTVQPPQLQLEVSSTVPAVLEETPQQQQQQQQPLLLRPIASEPSLRGHRRSSSLPSLGRRAISLDGPPRRAIFGTYWEKKAHYGGIPTVQSLATMPISTTAMDDERNPMPLSSSMRPTRYVPLMDMPPKQLPPPPPLHPLQSRTNHNEGWTGNKKNGRPMALTNTMVTMPATNGGAYPLCSPRSILRRRAVNSSDPTHTLRFLEQQHDPLHHHHHRRDSSESSTELPFALTKSIKQFQRKQQQVPEENDDQNDDDETEDSSWCSSASSHRGKSTTHIHFNPIVLVTEFEENPNDKRQWFTERELSRFQHDAIGRARAYLHSRPKLAEEYNQLQLCSVTGTMRKKALFSLPALSSIVEDVLPKVFSADFQKLAEHELRNILIVDPNKTVRDLFCKCLHSLFPWARILGTPTGEEALKVMERGLLLHRDDSHAMAAMDLVIVAEKLSRCRPHDPLSPTLGAVTRKTMEDQEVACTSSSSLSSSPTPTTNHTHGMTSYELLRRIRSLEESVCGKAPLPDTSTTEPPRRPLVIAVALNLAHDAEQLEACGADVAWGIPPPSPCVTLRNQVIYALIAKRRFRGDDAGGGESSS